MRAFRPFADVVLRLVMGLRRKYVAALAVLALGLGPNCGSTKMTTTTGNKYEPREPTCAFKLVTTLPEGKWEEIAIIDVNPGGYGHNVFRELEDFQEEIRPKVCEAGGDIALATANGYGMWIKATVLKKGEPTAPADAPAPVEPAASAVAQAPPAAPIGCGYDTQCKGDRICVEGACVDPKPAPPPAP